MTSAAFEKDQECCMTCVFEWVRLGAQKRTGELVRQSTSQVGRSESLPF